MYRCNSKKNLLLSLKKLRGLWNIPCVNKYARAPGAIANGDFVTSQEESRPCRWLVSGKSPVLRLLRNSRYSRHVAICKKDLVRGTQSFKRQRVTPLKVVAGIRARSIIIIILVANVPTNSASCHFTPLWRKHSQKSLKHTLKKKEEQLRHVEKIVKAFLERQWRFFSFAPPCS